MKTVTHEDLPRTLGRPNAPLLVDVLGPAAADTPPRAVRVPYGPDFVGRFSETLEDNDQPVLVFGSPTDSATVLDAALSLEEAGYRRVQCYLGARADLTRSEGDVSTHSPEARVGHQPKPIIAGVGEPGGTARGLAD